MTVAVKATDVGKTFPTRGGEVVALTGVDLEVADGEFVVLVGPSGCGKSTSLRMLAGLESVETGWHEYTTAQIDAVLELSVALHAAFAFKDVLGHDDIAPDRKKDPGPLFPLDALRGRLFGRR